MLSVDEISDFLAHDFGRYENPSKDFCALPCFAFSYAKVISPKFDAEEDLVSKYAMSSFGGVCDGSLYINTHDDFYVEKEDVEIRSIAGSFSSYFHEDEIDFYCSYDEESNSNEVVHSNGLFEENFDMDQHIVKIQFHDDSCDFASNHCQSVRKLQRMFSLIYGVLILQMRRNQILNSLQIHMHKVSYKLIHVTR